MQIIVVTLATWLLTSIVVSLFLGRMIALGGQEQPTSSEKEAAMHRAA
jgi:hypothetical protein